MITGFATPDGTAEHGRRYDVAAGRLGATGLTAARAGFGGYRINSGVPTHEAALEAALRAGINLIDTSTNYADGGSESLVGNVVTRLVDVGRIQREGIIVVSKVGYLQGRNFELSRQRKQAGRPFPELVEYGPGLEHCVHPEFIEDQLTRSLERLGLSCLDVCLLHNPEYYLGWARKQGIAVDDARDAYHRRIRNAFAHLEQEVARGRIRWYGISSNTFGADADDPEFTSLTAAWEAARSVSEHHHFRVMQLPVNLLEPGAILDANQPDGETVLAAAAARDLGVLVNRPLNAMAGNRLVRLADLPDTEPATTDAVIDAIGRLEQSETRLRRHILPALSMAGDLKVRVKEQNAVADILKHHWNRFGSFDRFRQTADGMIRPRVSGVLEFLVSHAESDPRLADWLTHHPERLKDALSAVGSRYAADAAKTASRLQRQVAEADPDWAGTETLSQAAVRALRSTEGIGVVLVGMRRTGYVNDVLAELRRPVEQKDRRSAWRRLSNDRMEWGSGDT